MNGQTFALTLAFTKDPKSSAKIAVIAEAAGLGPGEAIGLVLQNEEAIEKTVSGTVVTVNDAVNAALSDCTVTLSPVQSGSETPGPDNVRPIAGWNGVTVYRSGEYTDDPDEYAFDWTEDAGILYGGTVDTVSGEMTVTHYGVEYDGTENEWQFYAPYNQAFMPLPFQCKYDNATGVFWTCNTLKPTSYSGRSSSIGNFASVGSNGTNVAMSAPNCDTLEKFKAWAGSHHIMFVYQLNTPFTRQFTPDKTVRLMRGINNIWSNGDSVSITYWARKSQ